jgi:hypothetical protein
MLDYSIRRELLSEGEASRLEELGAELGPRWLKIEKILSRREMLEVWAILCELRERTDDHESDYINFCDWRLVCCCRRTVWWFS